jgi:hypothetical protein
MGHFNTSSSYFGRADLWSANESSRGTNDLTENALQADRLLMTDMLQSIPQGKWAYNHGKNPGLYFDVAPRIDGIHHLYGDGHVIWKNSKQFDLNQLTKSNPNIGWVSDQANNVTFY